MCRGATAKYMHEHASARSDQREQCNREGTNGCARSLEQWRETHEQKKKTEDAKKIRGRVHDNNKNKRLSRVQKRNGELTHHDEQELLSVWEGWHWDDNKGGWLDPELCARARREEVELLT